MQKTAEGGKERLLAEQQTRQRRFHQLMGLRDLTLKDLLTSDPPLASARRIREYVRGKAWPTQFDVRKRLADAFGCNLLEEMEDPVAPSRQSALETGGQAGASLTAVFGSYTGEEALEAIAKRVERAKIILNTGITEPSLPPMKPSPAMQIWINAARRAIHTCSVFKDVMCESFSAYAVERMREAEEARRAHRKCGSYEYRIVSCPQGGFLNFTVFEYFDRTKECFFGWTVNRQVRLEAPCVSSTDPSVVRIFETLHGQLFGVGSEPQSR